MSQAFVKESDGEWLHDVGAIPLCAGIVPYS